MTIEKRYISRVELSIDFAYASTRLEYGADKLNKMDFTLGESPLQTVIRLAEFLEKRHFIEIYSGDDAPGWGRVKAMNTFETDNSRLAAGIGFYTGFFHGRIKTGKADPLIVLSFRGQILDIPVGYDSAYELAIFHAVSDHKVLFGEGEEKYSAQLMRDKRHHNSNILNFTVPLKNDSSDQSETEY